MTIIVGIPHGGSVYLGGDAQGTHASGAFDIRTEPKVWEHGGLVFGGTSSFRELQILRYRFALPALPESADDDSLWPWLVNAVVDALRTARKEAGCETKFGDGSEAGPQFMLGVFGRLFVFETDYQVYEQPRGFAVGSGSPFALGSLSTSSNIWKSPHRRLEAALWAACAHDTGCRAPFTIVRSARWVEGE
jgi:hypothetical protein